MLPFYQNLFLAQKPITNFWFTSLLLLHMLSPTKYELTAWQHNHHSNLLSWSAMQFLQVLDISQIGKSQQWWDKYLSDSNWSHWVQYTKGDHRFNTLGVAFLHCMIRELPVLPSWLSFWMGVFKRLGEPEGPTRAKGILLVNTPCLYTSVVQIWSRCDHPVRSYG